jgi:hypothetical protein
VRRRAASGGRRGCRYCTTCRRAPGPQPCRYPHLAVLLQPAAASRSPQLTPLVWGVGEGWWGAQGCQQSWRWRFWRFARMAPGARGGQVQQLLSYLQRQTSHRW